MANLPSVRGRLFTASGRIVLAARCPLCGQEHRYDKGSVVEPDTGELLAAGFSDEWMPCQFDLPGNFWRITVVSQRRRRSPGVPGSGEQHPVERDRNSRANGS